MQPQKTSTQNCLRDANRIACLMPTVGQRLRPLTKYFSANGVAGPLVDVTRYVFSTVSVVKDFRI